MFVVYPGHITYIRTFSEAEQLSADMGSGTLILADVGWEIWLEGRDYDDENDWRRHLWTLEVKHARKRRGG